MIRRVRPHIPPLERQAPDIVTRTVSGGSMARAPPPRISIVPGREVLRLADFEDCTGVAEGGAVGVPEEGEGGPGSRVLILEFCAGEEEEADGVNVADEEGVVQWASG